MLGYNEATYLTAKAELEAEKRDAFELDDIVDYAAATVLDIGTSTLNSLAHVATLPFGGIDKGLDTGEILHYLNEDAGRFYDQNKDLVHLSSFIGGMFIPGIAASKAFKYAKTGHNWIGRSERAIDKSMDIVKNELRSGAKGSQLYNQAMSSMRLNTMGQGVAEGIMQSAAFTLAMNKHASFDPDYDVEDFLIFSALGSIGGPIRLIQQSATIRKVGKEILTPQVAAFNVPFQVRGSDPGTILGYKGFVYNNVTENLTKKFNADYTRYGELAVDEAGTSIVKHVYNMFDDNLKMADKLLIPKSAPRVARTDFVDDFFNSLGPSDTISQMVRSKPGIFNGVEKFTAYNAETPMASSLAKAAIELGPKAKPKQIQAAATIDEMAIAKDYLVPHGKLVEHFEKIGAPPVATVIDPYVGSYFLSETEALSAAGAAAYKSLGMNTKLGLYDKMLYNPLRDSIAKTEIVFMEAAHAINKAKIGAEIALKTDDAIIPKLQALINRFDDASFPQVTLQDPKLQAVTLSTKEEALKHLWQLKQEVVRTGRAIEGISTLQLAKATNLPVDTVDTILASGTRVLPFDPKLKVIRWTDKDYTKYLKTPAIQVEGKGLQAGQLEEIKAVAAMDAEQLATISNDIVRKLITKAKAGPELQELLENVIQNPFTKAIEAELKPALVALEPKWHTFTSREMAFRELGALGEYIVTYGKNFINTTNKQVKRLQEAVAPAAKLVSIDNASRIQFSQLKQTLHSLPIESAEKLVYDPKTQKIITHITGTKKNPTIHYLKYLGKEEDIILTTQMDDFMRSWLPVQDEMLEMHNVARELAGLPRTKGAGVWFPYPKINEEFIGFIIPNDPIGKPQLIAAKTAGHFKEKIAAAQDKYGSTHRILTRDIDSIEWNNLHRYSQLDDLKVADITLKKEGFALSDVTAGIDDIADLVGAVQADIWTKNRIIAKSANSTIFDQLDFFARREIASRGGQATGVFAKAVQRKVSTPELVADTMLSKSDLYKVPVLDSINNLFTAKINTAIHKASEITNKLYRPGVKIEDEFAGISKDLARANIPNPWKDAMEYHLAKVAAEGKDIALHRVQQANSIHVLFNLRLLEAAHAAVTTLSFPVIVGAEVAHKTGKAGTYPLKYMMDAAKWWNKADDAEIAAVKAYAKANGYTKGVVAETTEAMRSFLIPDINPFKKHPKVLEKLTGLSDFAEDFVREHAFAVGYKMAKAKNPTAPMEVLAASANAFTMRTMGNYVPRQRPTLFQGTFGAMIGLYQTFMLTMGQNIFRYTEAKDIKAISQLLVGQSAMFGIESLPGYEPFNRVLGAYVNDRHEDLTTTVYDAFGDTSDQSRSMAEMILFGLPSTLFGTGIYTRATLDPRTPLTITAQDGLSFSPAIYNGLVQLGEFVGNTVSGLTSAVGEGGSMEDIPTAFLQGIAAQSLWRPAARWSEIALGSSFDQKGELISTAQEVIEPSALFARAIGARPLKEQALRNLRYTSSYYNGIDNDRRQSVIKQLRRIATEEASTDQINGLFAEYVQNGGKYSGWKRIMNEAFMATKQPYAVRLMDFSKEQGAIRDVVETYGY